MRVRLVAIVAASVLTVGGCSASGDDRLVVAAGTTLVDSGFLELVVAVYEASPQGSEVSVVGLSSAEALSYAEAGNADVAITHEPGALDEFRASNPGSITFVPFSSRFILVGPTGYQARGSTIVDAFRGIAASGDPFVSRDDGSGTFAREQVIWSEVPHSPADDAWYIRTGSGMASTLLVASQRDAVTLTELGAYLSVSADLALEEVDLGSAVLLDNPYDLTVVDTDDDGAVALAEWIAGTQGRAAIEAANEQLFGMQVYRAP